MNKLRGFMNMKEKTAFVCDENAKNAKDVYRYCMSKRLVYVTKITCIIRIRREHLFGMHKQWEFFFSFFFFASSHTGAIQ